MTYEIGNANIRVETTDSIWICDLIRALGRRLVLLGTDMTTLALTRPQATAA